MCLRQLTKREGRWLCVLSVVLFWSAVFTVAG